MNVFPESIDIDAPAGAVWAILSDVERWPEWAPTFERVTRVGAQAAAPGAVYRIEQPRLPPALMTVDVWEPGKRFDWSSRKPLLRTVGVHAIEPLGPRSSRVTLEFRFEGALAPLVAFGFGKLVREYVASEARSLKARVERGTAAR